MDRLINNFMSRLTVNTFYDQCIELAKQSPCQKRGFGCIMVDGVITVAKTFNHHLDCARHLCEPTCIRFSINSGADSMIGACGHAEEHAIWQCIQKIGSAEDAKLYVAGVSKPDNIPLIKTEPSFYCIRCATLMQYAKVSGVHIWIDKQWHFLTADEAYASSLQYALREKKLSSNGS